MDMSPFHDDGYQVARGVVARTEIAEIVPEIDRLRELALSPMPLDPPLRVLRTRAPSGATVLRVMQNAHLISTILDGLRLHHAIADILQALLGPDIKTVLTSLFWKPPGELATGIGYHRDAQFRTPAEAYRNLSHSYVQIAIALDPQDIENGCLHFVPGSHRFSGGPAAPGGSVLDGDAGLQELRAFGFAPDAARPVQLDPGDIVFWSAFTLHGSPPNRSRDRDRRSFTIASMRSRDCDIGTDAFVSGRPVPVPRS